MSRKNTRIDSRRDQLDSIAPPASATERESLTDPSSSTIDQANRPPPNAEAATASAGASSEGDDPNPPILTVYRIEAAAAYGFVSQIGPMQFGFSESIDPVGTPRAALFVKSDENEFGRVAISTALGDLDFFPMMLVEESPKLSLLVGVARGLHVPEGITVAVPFQLPQDERQLGAIARRLLAARTGGIRCPIWAQRWRLRGELEGGGAGRNPWTARLIVSQAGIGEEIAARKDLDSLHTLFGVALQAVANNAIEVV